MIVYEHNDDYDDDDHNAGCDAESDNDEDAPTAQTLSHAIRSFHGEYDEFDDH